MNKPDRGRKRGNPKRKWMDCIERDLRIDWRDGALKRDEWEHFRRWAKTGEGL